MVCIEVKSGLSSTICVWSPNKQSLFINALPRPFSLQASTILRGSVRTEHGILRTTSGRNAVNPACRPLRSAASSSSSPNAVSSLGSLRRTLPIVAASSGDPIPGAELQRSDLVAYQGVPGAYSEAAALKACPGKELLPCDQFETAFQALSQYLAEGAVLPIENSLGGSIHTVYDLLLRYRLHIVGETTISVNHCLLAMPGVKKENIKRVLSHPQALAQTDGYTRRMHGVIREAVDDTAGAAKAIAENKWMDAAAVASRRAGELYNLEILDEGIQDMKDNVTRFLVLSREPLVTNPEDSIKYKTSIAFSLKEGPGMLFKALSVFALREIDLTKIESRPLRDKPIVLSNGFAENSVRGFNYLFYIDFLGALSDPKCQNALRHLQEIAPFLRVLGSYPRDVSM